VQASGPCAPDTWPFEPKINRLRQTVENYYCAKFQVMPIRGFLFIVLTYTPTPTHPHTHRDKVVAISASPCYAVGADSKEWLSSLSGQCTYAISSHYESIAVLQSRCPSHVEEIDVDCRLVDHIERQKRQPRTVEPSARLLLLYQSKPQK